MPMLEGYTPLAGNYLPINAARNSLHHAGLRHPKTGSAVSEALLIGISGGLGCGYILWQFKGRIGTVVTLGFTYRWNYGKEVLSQLCERVGARVRWAETGGRGKAAKDLAAALHAGKAPSAWLDQVHLGHLRQPAHLEGCFSWHATICGREPGALLVHDVGAHPRVVPEERLAASRSRIGSYKNRLLIVEELGPVDWNTAVRAGVADCARYLSEPSQSFSIPAIEKWSRLVLDDKNKKGWRKAFPDGRGLTSALRTTYANIEHGLGDGTGLRATYADFCAEGSALADWPGLAHQAQPWAEAGAAWAAVAEAAMPTGVVAFDELRNLMAQRSALLAGPSTVASELELDAVCARLGELSEACDETCPLGASEREEVLEALSAALAEAVRRDTAAVRSLAELVG